MHWRTKNSYASSKLVLLGSYWEVLATRIRNINAIRWVKNTKNLIREQGILLRNIRLASVVTLWRINAPKGIG